MYPLLMIIVEFSINSVQYTKEDPNLEILHIYITRRRCKRNEIIEGCEFCRLSCDIDGLIAEAQIIENRMKNVRAEQKRISYIV